MDAILLVAQLTYDLNMNIIFCCAIYLVVSAISPKFYGKASKEKNKQCNQQEALLLASKLLMKCNKGVCRSVTRGSL